MALQGNRHLRPAHNGTDGIIPAADRIAEHGFVVLFQRAVTQISFELIEGRFIDIRRLNRMACAVASKPRKPQLDRLRSSLKKDRPFSAVAADVATRLNFDPAFSKVRGHKATDARPASRRHLRHRGRHRICNEFSNNHRISRHLPWSFTKDIRHAVEGALYLIGIAMRRILHIKASDDLRKGPGRIRRIVQIKGADPSAAD